MRPTASTILFAWMLLAATAARAACPSAPIADCRMAAQQSLKITRGTTPDRDRFAWTWSNGHAPTLTDYGSPGTSTSLSLCLYDADALIASFDLTAGGTCGSSPCWGGNTRTFTYDDAAGVAAGVRVVRLKAGSHGTIKISGKGTALPDPALPATAPLTLQLLRNDSRICFESIFTTEHVRQDDAATLRAKATVTSNTPLPALHSGGCGLPTSGFTLGASTVGSLVHDGLTRTYRVYLPSAYDPDRPTPLVFLLHGGFGSGAQIEGSANLLAVAEANGFVVVSPDGVLSPANIRTWNGGGCCGYAVSADVDDVGFVAAILDTLEDTLCVDRRRVYATGMSNGAILSHRLACDLADRIRAVAPVEGAMMAAPCNPVRPVSMLIVHGTADANIPFDGGTGCGVAGVSFPSVAQSLLTWTTAAGCGSHTAPGLAQGDGSCTARTKCAPATDVWLCTIANGGHQWPGGDPPLSSGLPGCPFAFQSQTFSASAVAWSFFSTHPPR